MNWRVMLFDLSIDQEEIDEVTRILQSRWLAMGQETKELEREFSASLGVDEAVVVSSGTAALHIAALALGIGPGDEVIVPSLSFVANASTIAMTGARPVFADIRGIDDLTIDPEEIERLITQRTKAIVVMHYGGYPANMEAVLKIARKHQLKVIEDAAHSPLVQTPQGMLGTLGDVGCFSLFSTKNITMGEGGVLVAKEQSVLQQGRALRSHYMTSSSWDKQQGRASEYDIQGLGFNYRPTDLTAAIGRVQLRKSDYDRQKRRMLAKIYHQHLQTLPGIQLPYAGYTGDTAHHLLPIILPPTCNRSALQLQLREAGIQSSVHYPPIHLFQYYQAQYGCHKGMLARTEMVAARQLSLPLHARMQEEDAVLVVEILRQALKAQL
ncbi:MAG: DegT/DnrJ/EryC1/StrS family aminotransferase [Roseiflexaceae bacterium]